MVQLSLLPLRGNQATLYFPYTGNLALTPLKVDGVVRTKLDDDLKPLPSTSLTVAVRCYEYRLSRFGTSRSNVLADYTQVLWSKPDHQDYGDVGNLDYTFQIIVPPSTLGHSTAHFPEYRIVWRVEAVLNHLPLSGVGCRLVKHYELLLVRYGVPPSPHPPKPVFSSSVDLRTLKTRFSAVGYRINVPSTTIGPSDVVSIPLSILPADSSISIRSTTLNVERRIQLSKTVVSSQTSSTPSTRPSSSSSSSNILTPSHSGSTPPIPPIPPTSLPTPCPSDISLASYPSTGTPSFLSLESSAPLLPPPVEVPSKVVHAYVTGTDSDQFTRDVDGVWQQTLTFQWPSTRARSRWAVGETMQGELATVKFFLRIKLVVACSSGSETVELADQELTVTSTNEADRQQALTGPLGHSETRSKSKSPRRQKRAPQQLPTPPKSPNTPKTGGKDALASFPVPSKSKTRRPHTSTGSKGDGKVLDGVKLKDHKSEERLPTSACDDGAIISMKRVKDALFLSASRKANEGQTPAGGVAGTAHTCAAVHAEDVRSWEDELERIENQSRRNSEGLLGFFSRRKRAKTDGHD